MSTEVRVPTLGESVTEATVATWFKKPGDAVAVDEMLCELETDKVTVEVPSPVAGKLDQIVAEEGTTVGAGGLLAVMGEAGESTEIEPRAKEKPEEAKPAPEGTEGKSGTREAAAGPAGGGPSAGGSGGGTVEVKVPTLGESVTEATVATWFKAEGDAVAQDEMLCELETDKVSVEVPAPAAGVLSKILKSEGETVEAGGTLARIDSAGAGAAAPAQEEAPPPAAQPDGRTRDVEDAPSARKAMAEKGLSRDQVTGTGRDGRVMKEDVAKAGTAHAAGAQAGSAKSSSQAAAPSAPAQPAREARGPVLADDAEREERVKMTRLRQTIARRLKDAQNTAAMLTTYNEVDMSAVMGLRTEYKELFEKKHGVKLGFMSFFTKACCHALREVPEVNAEIDGTDVVYKNFVHMGIAVGTPTGLVVPVIRDADAMSFAEIEKTHQRAGRQGARRQAVDGRHAGRHLHDLERRRLRLADVLADPEPAAVGNPRHAQDPWTARWSSAARSWCGR